MGRERGGGGGGVRGESRGAAVCLLHCCMRAALRVVGLLGIKLRLPLAAAAGACRDGNGRWQGDPHASPARHD